MAKTVSLNEFVYAQVVALSGELTAATLKPISIGMAVYVAVAFFRRTLAADPNLEKVIMEKLKTLDLMDPETFDKVWDKVI